MKTFKMFLKVFFWIAVLGYTLDFLNQGVIFNLLVCVGVVLYINRERLKGFHL